MPGSSGSDPSKSGDGSKLTCFYCGRPATKLCDGVIARISDDGLYVRSPAWENLVTCNRPLCDECMAFTHIVFFDGTTKGGRRVGWRDSVDICPQCDREGRSEAGNLKYAPLVREQKARQMQAARQQGQKGILL